MVRRIIEIDQAKCNGCGACAAACHEGAIGMVNDKATLLRDDYCDGLGDCLPTCPTGAIQFVEREAAAYDEAAVLAKKSNSSEAQSCSAWSHTPSGCPGSRPQELRSPQEKPAGALGRLAQLLHPGPKAPAGGCPGTRSQVLTPAPAAPAAQADGPLSQLRQWPVQIKLVPTKAPWLDGADVLIAADCTAYARADFHQRFIQGRITLIGCPKLDEGDYADKLTELLRQNSIASLTVVRMDVPCCGGIQRAVETARKRSGSSAPCRIVTLGRNGEILNEQE